MAPENIGAAMVKADCFRFRLNHEVASTAFISAQLNVSANFDAGTLATGTTRSRIPLSTTSNRAVLVPGLAEQDEITKYCADICERLEALASEAQSAITLLLERRAALISAAVTGKIDVRGVVEASNVVALPTNARPATLPSHRALIGAYGVRHLGQMGRMAVMKVGYLAEGHVGIPELAGTYQRNAAGPYDYGLINAMERGAATICGITTVEPSSEYGAVRYVTPKNLQMPSDALETVLGPDRARAFLNLIDLLKDLGREGVEAVATLYAVWNDLIASGRDAGDDAICHGVLNEWHPEKRQKFTRNALEHWLAWMRRNGLVPDGSAPRTDRQGDLFA
jgi:type I restriction enzyme S subunit